MGGDLKRRMVSFRRLIPPESIVSAKLSANALEDELAVDGVRSVNLDVGYFDLHKIVLASCKFDGPKVCLGEGIYADVVCRYSEGEFVPSARTFPDLQARLYDIEFLEIRRLYKQSLRD